MRAHYQQIDVAFAALGDDNFSLPEPVVIDSAQNLKKPVSTFIMNPSPSLTTSPTMAVTEPKNDERKSSFLHSILATILFMLAILCGYFALPTTKSVAVSTGTASIEKRYVTKNIEDIQVGDEVYAFDIETNETVKRRVTNVLQRTSDHLRYLTVHDSNETQIFETTDSHPFWVVTDTPDLSRAAQENVTDNGVWLHHENVDVTEHGYYVEAGNLRVGDIFISPHGKLSTLEKTELTEYPNGITVYNFEVENNHNYFVIANPEAFQNGAEPVLVHNNLKCLKNGESPPNLAPAGATARAALRAAKRNSNVPQSAQPKIVPNFKDNNPNRPLPGEQWHYKDVNGNDVIIRHEPDGHQYPKDPSQNRGSHFHDKDGGHYDY